jgi:hypothetical protein
MKESDRNMPLPDNMNLSLHLPGIKTNPKQIPSLVNNRCEQGNQVQVSTAGGKSQIPARICRICPISIHNFFPLAVLGRQARFLDIPDMEKEEILSPRCRYDPRFWRAKLEKNDEYPKTDVFTLQCGIPGSLGLIEKNNGVLTFIE